MMGVIVYKTEAGYTAKLFGEKSLVIINPAGMEVYKTSNRTVNTLTGLKKFADEWIRGH